MSGSHFSQNVQKDDSNAIQTFMPEDCGKATEDTKSVIDGQIPHVLAVFRIAAETNKIIKKKSTVISLETTLESINLEKLEAEAAFREAERKLTIKGLSVEEVTQNRKMVEDKEQRMQRARQQMERTQDILKAERLNLGFARDALERILKQALAEANLLAPLENQRVERPMPNTDARGNFVSHTDDNNPKVLDPEEITRRDVAEVVDKAANRLKQAQHDFDQQGVLYQNDLREYTQEVREGTCDMPQTEFDQVQFGFSQRATRELIEAEKVYSEAVGGAQHLGIGIGSDQESKFVDETDDGYCESHEAEVVGTDNVAFIECWRQQVSDGMGSVESTIYDEDEWDARSLDFGESLSTRALASGRARVRISRWDAVRAERWRTFEKPEHENGPQLEFGSVLESEQKVEPNN